MRSQSDSIGGPAFGWLSSKYFFHYLIFFTIELFLMIYRRQHCSNDPLSNDGDLPSFNIEFLKCSANPDYIEV